MEGYGLSQAAAHQRRQPCCRPTGASGRAGLCEPRHLRPFAWRRWCSARRSELRIAFTRSSSSVTASPPERADSKPPATTARQMARYRGAGAPQSPPRFPARGIPCAEARNAPFRTRCAARLAPIAPFARRPYASRVLARVQRACSRRALHRRPGARCERYEPRRRRHRLSTGGGPPSAWGQRCSIVRKRRSLQRRP
jgi:hypothetical protein